MNSRSASFGEFLRLCAQRLTLMLVMVIASFAVIFTYLIITTPTQYVFRGSIRLQSLVSGQTISDQSDLAALASAAANTSVALIENTDTVGAALTATHLTDMDAAVMRNRITAERINDSDIISVTVIFDNDYANANTFTFNLLSIACERISQADFYGTSFTATIVEQGREIEARGRFAPSFGGAAVAAGAALLLFLLMQMVVVLADKTLRSGDKFEKLTSVPVVASIPPSSRLGGEGSGNKVSNAYRVLRSAIKYSKDKVRTVAVCSAAPKDGRTSVAIGLANALAETDAMVLLIEGDMRRPNISMEMHIESVFGLADLLLGKANLASTICKTANRNLYVITAVNSTNLSNINISDLLDSAVFDELLEAVSNQFDYIIIDTPAVDLVPDATSVIGKVDCALAVAQYGRTPVDALRAAIDVFTASGGNLLGIVATNAVHRSGWFGSISNYYKGPARRSRAAEKQSKLADVFNMAERDK